MTCDAHQLRGVSRQIVSDYEARAKLWMSPLQNAERYLRPLVLEFVKWLRRNRDTLYQESATEGLLSSIDENLRYSLKHQVACFLLALFLSLGADGLLKAKEQKTLLQSLGANRLPLPTLNKISASAHCGCSGVFITPLPYSSRPMHATRGSRLQLVLDKTIVFKQSSVDHCLLSHGIFCPHQRVLFPRVFNCGLALVCIATFAIHNRIHISRRVSTLFKSRNVSSRKMHVTPPAAVLLQAGAVTHDDLDQCRKSVVGGRLRHRHLMVDPMLALLTSFMCGRLVLERC